MNRHAFPFRLLRLCLLLVAIGLVPQAHTQSLELEPVGTVRLPAGQQVLRTLDHRLGRAEPVDAPPDPLQERVARLGDRHEEAILDRLRVDRTVREIDRVTGPHTRAALEAVSDLTHKAFLDGPDGPHGVGDGGRAALAAGWTCDEVPVADGGEGTLDVLGGPNRITLVTGPLGDVPHPVRRPQAGEGVRLPHPGVDPGVLSAALQGLPHSAAR